MEFIVRLLSGVKSVANCPIMKTMKISGVLNEVVNTIFLWEGVRTSGADTDFNIINLLGQKINILYLEAVFGSISHAAFL